MDIQLSREASLFGSTSVENIFIEEYMPAARGEYVKVYLYLLKCAETAAPPTTSLALGGLLDMDEASVEQAVAYWLRMGVMRQDEGGSLAFNHLATTILAPTKQSAKLNEERLLAFADFNRQLEDLFENRTLKPDEYRRAQDWATLPGSSQRLALLVCRYSVTRSRAGRRVAFSRIEETLQRWLADHVNEEEAAAKVTQAQRGLDGSTAVLRRLGEAVRLPSQDEEALYQKWTREWGFAPEAVLSACAQTTAARTPSFAYLDRVLHGLKTSQKDGAGVQQTLSDNAKERALAGTLQRELGLPGAVTPAALAVCSALLTAGLEPDALPVLARDIARRGGGLTQVERLGCQLAQQELRSKEAITNYFSARRKQEEGLLQLFDAMGLMRRATAGELATYQNWRAVWQMPQEVLLLAAGKAAHAQKPFPYLEGVVKQWHEDGLRTPQAVFAQTPKAQKNARSLNALQYQQRTYTDEQLKARLAEDV